MKGEIYIHNNGSSGIIYQAPSAAEAVKRGASLSFSSPVKYLAVLGFIFLSVNFTPSLIYAIESAFNPNKTGEYLAETATKGLRDRASRVSSYQPPINDSLPKDNALRIPSIGVEAKVNEAEIVDYEEALKKGIWRVSDFGNPYERGKPTILVAHRFGYLFWSNTFRRQNSFYNLPNLKEGNRVEIIWNQRKYVYEIQGSAKGEEISDYGADLILYTCESLNTPVRIFKYAKLLEI